MGEAYLASMLVEGHPIWQCAGACRKCHPNVMLALLKATVFPCLVKLQSYIDRNEWLVFWLKKKKQKSPKTKKAETEPGFNISFPFTVWFLGLFSLSNAISNRKLGFLRL